MMEPEALNNTSSNEDQEGILDKSGNSKTTSRAGRWKILFDESHQELLRWKGAEDEDDDDEEADSWSILHKELERLDCKADYSEERELITDTELSKYDVLVLAAPTKPLQLAEVEAIVKFVRQGKSLLIAINDQSLSQQRRSDRLKSLFRLVETFGLHIKELLSYPPEEISTLHPHYLSSEVNRIFVDEPTYLETLRDLPEALPNSSEYVPLRYRLVASLPWTNQPFLIAIEPEGGRVIAVGDFVIFNNKFINRGDNKQLAKNIFCWLTRQNPLDCFDAQIKPEVQYGQTATFSIILQNPNPKRIEHIRCLLESDAGATIKEPVKNIRSLASHRQTHLQWVVEPKQLGFQSLRLIVDFLQEPKPSSLFFDCVAQFKCLPDVEIDLVVLNQKGEIPEVVETGNYFEVQAVIKRTINVERTALQLHLDCSLSHFKIEAVEHNGVDCWRLTALDEGDWPITLVVSETGQHISRLIHVRRSAQEQIVKIEQDIVAPLMAEAHHRVVQLRQEFDEDSIQKIPFRLLTPEQQVQQLYPPDKAKYLLEALQAARQETHSYEPLIKQLLNVITPTYSPVHGCCIPYAPKLARHLVREHALYEENLANHFLQIEGYAHYDEVWLRQNIAALLLHEKYGHGFFFKQTTLGQQLEILDRHGLLSPLDAEGLRTPYLRALYKNYGSAIQALNHSAIVVNEGFATWIELLILPKLSGVVSQAFYRRRDFLFNYDDSLERLSNRSQYFKKFPPLSSSRYQEGYDYLDLIQGYFGKDCGPKCAVQAMVKAADVNVGINECVGKVQFGLAAEELNTALLDPDEEDDARADMRLRRIHYVLRENCEFIRAKQQQLQCHRTCLHWECPVNRVISDKLGW